MQIHLSINVHSNCTSVPCPEIINQRIWFWLNFLDAIATGEDLIKSTQSRTKNGWRRDYFDIPFNSLLISAPDLDKLPFNWLHTWVIGEFTFIALLFLFRKWCTLDHALAKNAFKRVLQSCKGQLRCPLWPQNWLHFILLCFHIIHVEIIIKVILILWNK